MKKIKVTRAFVDRFNRLATYKVGQVVTFEDDRAERIVGRGLGEYIDEEGNKLPQPKADETNPEPTAVETPNDGEGTADESNATESMQSQDVNGTEGADDAHEVETETEPNADAEADAEPTAEETEEGAKQKRGKTSKSNK